MSGRRGSNPPPEAWKATALPNELLPRFLVSSCRIIVNVKKTDYRKLFTKSGGGWIRTTEGMNQQIYSLPHLATLVHPLVTLKKHPKAV